MWRKGVLAHYWWECKLIQSLWKTLWRFLKKLKIELWYGQAYGYLSSEHKNTNLKRCIHFHCSIICKLANIRKEPMSCDRWMDKADAVYVYTIKHYSVINKVILPFVTTWMDLEGIMLSEISERKTSNVWFHIHVESKKEMNREQTKQNQTHRWTEKTGD